MQELGRTVAAKVGEIQDWFSGEFIDPFIDWLVQFPGKLWEKGKEVVTDIWNAIYGWFDTMGRRFIGWWNSFMPDFLQLTGDYMDIVKILGAEFLVGAIFLFFWYLPAIVGVIASALQGVGSALVAAGPTIGSFFTTIFSGIGGWLLTNQDRRYSPS